MKIHNREKIINLNAKFSKLMKKLISNKLLAFNMEFAIHEKDWNKKTLLKKHYEISNATKLILELNTNQMLEFL